MSAESELLFPQMDSFMLSDFSSFSEYEDFPRDVFVMSEVDGFPALEDLDCKDGLKPLLLSELNEFSTSLEGIKEEDEEDDMHSTKTHSAKGCMELPKDEHEVPMDEQPGLLQASKHAGHGSYTERIDMQEPVLTSGGISGMFPEDARAHFNMAKSWQATTSSCQRSASLFRDCSGSRGCAIRESRPSPASCTKQGDLKVQQPSDICTTMKSSITQLPCTPENSPLQCKLNANNVMHAEPRTPISTSIFNINSPLSSPSSSVTTHDRSCMLKVLSHEENGGMHNMNMSMVQPTRPAIDSGPYSSHVDAYHHNAPHYIMLDGSGISTMHRSRSSHALGQFQTSGQFGPYQEEVNVSPMQVPILGYMSPNNFPQYQAACSRRLVEGSPAATPMRRVFSTGDIQISYGGDNNLSRLDPANGEDNTGVKVGHYTLEERKLRLHRYRQKRNERNFSKKIQYACRKTLADSRPRIRGRFARTLDDSGEPLVKENGVSYDEDSDEVDTPTGIPQNQGHSFWNAMGMNTGVRRHAH